MVATRSARERKTASEAGPLAQVTIDVAPDDRFVYKIRCSACRTRGDRPWSTYRPGDENGFMAAMDRWTFHLEEKHPDVDAPCRAFLPAAQRRLHERREQRGTAPDADGGPGSG